MGGSEGSRLLQPVILRVGSAVPALGGPASRGQERPPFVRLTMPNGGDALVPVRAGMNNGRLLYYLFGHQFIRIQ